MADRKTKKDYFNELKEIVADNAELVAFLDRQIELASKKRTVPTKVQKENAETVERIYDYLAKQDAPVAIDAIVTEFEWTTTQKASALLKKLVDDGRVVKVKEGKKVAYQVAND